MQGFALEYDPQTIICREGDNDTDLYFLQSGKLLICTLNGTQVKALARISAGEFIGELSFFDGRPRSSYVITLEKCKLIRIPQNEVSSLLPNWYLKVGQSITKKIRLLDQVIHGSNIRRSQSEENRPLSMEEQRELYKLLTNQDT